jgi:outer membrane protein assembly factor BamA
MIRERFTPKFTVAFGPTFQRYEMDSTDKKNAVRFITDAPANGLDPNTAFESQMYFGGKLSINLDTRDNRVLPSKGVNWDINIRHLSGLKNTPYSVTQMNTDVSLYFRLAQNNRLVLANRFGGGINVGSKGFEFYQAQYLGSEDNLRGYRRFRFAGRSKMYNQAELRLKLADFKTYLFPGALGILTFFDAGKVWLENDPGNTKMQTGYGVGFWFSPLRRIMLTFTYAMSQEDKIPIIGLGWRF